MLDKEELANDLKNIVRENLKEIRDFLEEYWSNPDYIVPTNEIGIPYYKEEQYIQLHSDD